MATALVAAGTFAPVAALYYGFTNSAADGSSLAAAAGICLAGGMALHLVGRILLRRLRE
jgi:hypothetical protein